MKVVALAVHAAVAHIGQRLTGTHHISLMLQADAVVTIDCNHVAGMLHGDDMARFGSEMGRNHRTAIG